jgi:nucleoside 2-deoxyribosyltransferase
MPQRSVYLAGPEVFLANAREILDIKIALTREAGLIPIAPGDLEHPKTESAWELGLAIARIDEQLMDAADAIIANLTPFRGIAADTGTCFELGYMCAQGKPAFAYTNVRAGNGERTRGYYAGNVTRDDHGLLRGPDGIMIEDMGFVDNLMLHGGVVNRGGAVVVGDAAEGELYTDMTAFRRVLEIAAAKLGSARR